jgi:hypothetical protein
VRNEAAHTLDMFFFVKLWSTFRGEIQREMYRTDLDPEFSAWDDVVRAAELAERLQKINPMTPTLDEQQPHQRVVSTFVIS